MKFIECYVENFGNLSGKKIVFSDGVNPFLSKNGSGKTTFSFFLLSMLYGIGETRKESLAENDRKKYFPWNGGTFGGSLTVEHGGSIYRIERSFGAKPSADTSLIIDTDCGREVKLGCEFGEWALGIDRDGFLRTVFLSERSFSEKNDNKFIAARLSDIPSDDEDVNRLDQAMENLEARRKYFYRKGGGGVIETCRDEIRKIDNRLLSLGGKEEEYSLISAKLFSLNEEKQEILNSISVDNPTAQNGKNKSHTLTLTLTTLALCILGICAALSGLYIGLALIPAGLTLAYIIYKAMAGKEDFKDKNTKEKTPDIERVRRLGVIDAEILAAESEMRSNLEFISQLHLLEEERGALEDKLAELELSLSVIQKAEHYLECARESMATKYMDKIKDSFEYYLNFFGEVSDGYLIDSSFRISKTEGAKLQQNDSYSRGTRELRALALRLALIDALYDGDKPPLILDDPFIAFDDEKLPAAKNILRRLSSDRQILYFTCSISRGL